MQGGEGARGAVSLRRVPTSLALACHSPLPVATVQKLTSRSQAEHIVPVGALDPNEIHLPGIYVNRIVQATTPKEIEFETLAPEPGSEAQSTGGKRELIARVSGFGHGRGV